MAERLERADSIRLDKWLWYARVTKSRSLAQKLIAAGRVRLNGDKVYTPSKALRVSDVLTIAVARNVRVLKVVTLGARRGPADEARTLYDDLTAPNAPPVDERGLSDARTVGAIEAEEPRRDPGSGRPTKRDRRALARLREWEA